MKKSGWLLCLLLPGISCKKVILKDGRDSSAVNNFHYLWHDLDKRYAYFDTKKLDWNEVYSRYSPRVKDGMDEKVFFDVMKEFMNELKDGHSNLIAPFDASVYYPLFTNSPQHYNGRLVLEQYLLKKKNHRQTGPFDLCTLDTFGLQIAYCRYGSFLDNFTETQVNYLIDYCNNCNGVIFDLRSNGGGSSYLMYQLASRFFKGKQEVFQSSEKTGSGREDFSQPLKIYVDPGKKSTYLKTLVLLTNRGSYSASSFFTLAMKVRQHTIQIGDTTGGGLGVPSGAQLPNGWTYRFSVTKTLSLKGENFEAGIPPEIYCGLDSAAALAGYDSMIERAVMYIRDGF